MSQIISSFVLRITQEVDEASEGVRIRIKHIQSDEEVYLTSLTELEPYIHEKLLLRAEGEGAE